MRLGGRNCSFKEKKLGEERWDLVEEGKARLKYACEGA